MKKGEGPNAIRRIFRNVPYDKEEKKNIQIFKDKRLGRLASIW